MDAQDLSWDDLAVFLATAREGSLSAAARTLSVNHATVSRRIARLEEALDTRLFDRGARGYDLTELGQLLLRRVVRIEDEIVGLQRELAGRDQRLEGEVTLATVDDLAVAVLPEILKRFREAHPLLTVRVDVRPTKLDLSKMEADIALRFGKRPPHPRVVARKVANVTGAYYASEVYLSRHPAPQRLADLSQHEIVRGDDHFAHMPFELILDEVVDPVRVAYRSNSWLARLAMIRAGLGVGLLSDFQRTPGDGLVRLPIPTQDLDVALWIALHTDIRTNARVRALADFLYDALVAMRSRFDARAAE